jgi:hypothetical protein
MGIHSTVSGSRRGAASGCGRTAPPPGLWRRPTHRGIRFPGSHNDGDGPSPCATPSESEAAKREDFSGPRERDIRLLIQRPTRLRIGGRACRTPPTRRLAPELRSSSACSLLATPRRRVIPLEALLKERQKGLRNQGLAFGTSPSPRKWIDSTMLTIPYSSMPGPTCSVHKSSGTRCF